MSSYSGELLQRPREPLSATEHWQRRQTGRAGLSLAEIASVDYLAAMYDRMAKENGKATGPDHVSYGDLGRRELFNVLRPLSKQLIAGTYRPGPCRELQIPKAGNRGYRTLRIRSIVDRVVSKALAEVLTPHWEAIFLDGSHGFRPKRSPLTMLAQLVVAIQRENRWVLVSDDICKAFDNYPIDFGTEVHARHLPDPDILPLIDVVLRGGDPNHKTGIDQGSPYMPLALNVCLHEAFDNQAHSLGAKPGTSTPWMRYADNLVLALHDIEEGEQALQEARQLLQKVGFSLKGENHGHPVDLRSGGTLELLGFQLHTKGNKIRFRLGVEAWNKLRSGLLRAHDRDNPVDTAHAVLHGWIAAYGPAFRHGGNRVAKRIRDLASRLGFREIVSREYLTAQMHQAWDRWQLLVDQVELPALPYRH